MKVSDIQVGKTYRNRGAGKTVRTVIAIGDEHRPKSYHNSDGTPPANVPGVLYEQKGRGGNHYAMLYLNSFAAWCGSEVEE